jgi:LSD1 subclass zinc finger protein
MIHNRHVDLKLGPLWMGLTLRAFAMLLSFIAAGCFVWASFNTPIKYPSGSPSIRCKNCAIGDGNVIQLDTFPEQEPPSARPIQPKPDFHDNHPGGNARSLTPTNPTEPVPLPAIEAEPSRAQKEQAVEPIVVPQVEPPQRPINGARRKIKSASRESNQETSDFFSALFGAPQDTARMRLLPRQKAKPTFRWSAPSLPQIDDSPESGGSLNELFGTPLAPDTAPLHAETDCLIRHSIDLTHRC